MLNWALTFLIVALAAALLGFGGIAGDAAWIAKILFVVFPVMFLASALQAEEFLVHTARAADEKADLAVTRRVF